MMKLPPEYFELLRKCIYDNNQILFKNLKENDFKCFNSETINDFRECVCDELIKKGFNNEKVTDYGLKLENLIDLLGHFVQ